MPGHGLDLASVGGLLAGGWDADVVDELDLRETDLVVDKCRFDAFQWSSLEPLPRGLGATEPVVCGVVTNFCVETTVRSAVVCDFSVTVLEDACASITPRLYDIAIEAMRDCRFAAVTTSADFAGASAAA